MCFLSGLSQNWVREVRIIVSFHKFAIPCFVKFKFGGFVDKFLNTGGP